jgi:hypothetical protein
MISVLVTIIIILILLLLLLLIIIIIISDGGGGDGGGADALTEDDTQAARPGAGAEPGGAETAVGRSRISLSELLESRSEESCDK